LRGGDPDVLPHAVLVPGGRGEDEVDGFANSEGLVVVGVGAVVGDAVVYLDRLEGGDLVPVCVEGICVVDSGFNLPELHGIGR
jgi:hypothetical protein